MKKAGKLIIVTLLILSGLTAGAYFLLKGREGGPSNEFKSRMAKSKVIIRRTVPISMICRIKLRF